MFRYVDERLNGHSNETAPRGARNGRYHDPLPDTKSAGENRADHGNDSVRVLSSWIEVPFRCPACREVHRWTRKDAWVDRRSNGQGSATQKDHREVGEMPH